VKLKTKNIIHVMTDGLRWQEVFQGADASIMTRADGTVKDAKALEALQKAYIRATPEERREVLMPFLWTTVAKRGQIYGNREKGSEAYVTNGKNFSYPGYSETLCGFADDRIDSNDKNLNPNTTVMEWLHAKPAFKGKVAGFAAWDVLPYIFNAQRAGFPVSAGWEPFNPPHMTPQQEMVNRMKANLPRMWEDEPFDALPFFSALDYVKTSKPRVLYLSLGETDDWAHDRQYRLYLESAHRVDEYIKTLWETVQSMPQYKDSTTLIVSVDHGRGSTPANWRSHGKEVPESKDIWMAFLGPDTKPLGERSRTGAVQQNQIAATLAALLGEDYAKAQPKAGKPILDVLP
jgi:hypothetical protein